MKLTNQTYLPPIAPPPQPTVPGNSAPLTSGNGPQTADHSKIVYGSSAGNGGGIEYPTASNEKVGGLGASGAKASGPLKLKPKPKPDLKPKPKPDLKPTPTPTPKPKPKPDLKPKPKPTPKEGSAGIKDSLKNTQNINNLHDKNGFKSLPSELAAKARSSLISGGVSSLVNIPLSVGQHLASQAILDRIEKQAAMPGAEKKNADGTTTTVDPAATEKQKIDARLEESEIKTETMANQILSINEGPEAKAVAKGPDAPTDTNGRLGSLEKNMDGIETQMQDLGKRYGVIYTPYEAPKSSDTPTDKSRMDTIEQRHTHMNRMLKRLVKNAEADAEDS